MTPQKRAPEPRAYHHGDLRRSLISAAVTVLELRGLEGLSLRAVARQAKVSHAAPYHHFANRDQLVEAVAETGFADLRAFIVHHLETTTFEPGAMLQEAAVGYVLYAVAHPDVYRLMFGAALKDHNPSEALLASSAGAYDLIHGGIAGAFAGHPVDEVRATVLARTCWSIAHGIATLTIDGHLGEAEPGAVAEQTRAITGVLWQGLRSG